MTLYYWLKDKDIIENLEFVFRRLLMWSSKLTDTCDNNIPTCDSPTNSYTPKSMQLSLPNGKRIDYILYRPGRNCQVRISFLFHFTEKFALSNRRSFRISSA